MKRTWLVALLVIAALGGVLAFVAARTHWETESHYALPSLAALRDPFYGERQLLGGLGVAAREASRGESLPEPSAVLVLYQWNWAANAQQSARLRHWVESGGRLVVDRSSYADERFERWSGLQLVKVPVRRGRRADAAARGDADGSGNSGDDSGADDSDGNGNGGDGSGIDDSDGNGGAGNSGAGAGDGQARHCEVLRETLHQRATPHSLRLSICDAPGRSSYWRESAGASWSLDGRSGPQVRRYARGAGSVTAINAPQWRLRAALEGDHPVLWARALQLHRRDNVVFLRGDRIPGLLELIWRYGASVLLLALAAIALALWRAMRGFGPLLQPISSARRSLREQITGTTAFLARHGAALQLWQASVAALDAELIRHVPLPLPLADSQRLQALSELTELPLWRLNEALGARPEWRQDRLIRAIQSVESLRRRLRQHDSSRLRKGSS